VMFSGRSNGVHVAEVEKYALDIVKHSSIISLFVGNDLEKNETYGTVIYSPCVGYVKDLQDGIKDQPLRVKDSSAGGGNDIVIGCNGFNVYMAHIKSGSFRVKLGDKVQIGDELAEIGNSGNTDGPHLHIHAFKEEGEDIVPLPMTFNGRYLYKFDVVDN
ncbi:MAG: M23 family metallopeptidase, partial [Candidatus Dojkabacteria bacterium]|nr:M23 family metallopeptidase [Candidatus Dojkabacteria bacterium]